MQDGRTTLSKFLIDTLDRKPGPESASGLSALLIDVAASIKTISATLTKGALGGNHGSAETINTHGEEQKKLDLDDQRHLPAALRVGRPARGNGVGGNGRRLCDSRRLPARRISARVRSARWLVEHRCQWRGRFDLLRAARERHSPATRHFLRPVTNRWRRATRSTGHRRCSCFRSATACMASRLIATSATSCSRIPHIAHPRRLSRVRDQRLEQRFWEPPVQPLCRRMPGRPSGARGSDFNMRWIASMVAEAHRILMRGGVFMYPRDTQEARR